jgi:hypothetical protein
MREITLLNIAEYIRSEKKRIIITFGYKALGQKNFYWTPREFTILKDFVYNTTCEIFPQKPGGKPKRGIDFKEGMKFLGARHYKYKI